MHSEPTAEITAPTAACTVRGMNPVHARALAFNIFLPPPNVIDVSNAD
jgi:hypothetical protein